MTKTTMMMGSSPRLMISRSERTGMLLLIVIAAILASYATYAIARTIETIRRERKALDSIMFDLDRRDKAEE